MRKSLFIAVASAMLFNLTTQAAPVTLTMTINEDVFLVKWINIVKERYEKLHPDVKIKINSIISKGSEYHTKLAIVLPGDQNTDVLWIDDQQYHNFIKSKFICNIPELKNWDELGKYNKTIMDAHKYGDDYYAMPASAVVVGLFYNKAIFRKAGLPVPWEPKNWQDIYDAAQKIKEKVPKVWPIFIGLTPDMTTTFRTTLMFLYGTQGGALYKDGKWIVTSQGILDTYQFILKLVSNKLTIPKEFMFSMEQQSVEKIYLPDDKVAIDLDGCWIYRYYTGNKEKVKDKLGFAPMPTEYGQDPKYVTLQGDWLLTIASNSKHKKEAADFIKFAVNHENALEYCKIMSDLSPREDIAEDPAFPADLKIFMPYLKYSKYRPFAEEYPTAGLEISSAIHEVISSGGTAMDAMNIYAKNLEAGLGKENITKEYKEPQK